MHEKLIREINGEIADALLARKMPFAPSRKAALALLKVPGWTEGLEQMLPIRGRLECAPAGGGVAGLLHPVRPGADVPRSRLRP